MQTAQSECILAGGGVKLTTQCMDHTRGTDRSVAVTAGEESFHSGLITEVGENQVA